MAKKTSRAARVQQNTRQQDVKRELSARPIVGSTDTTGTRVAVAPEPLKMSISANDLVDAPTPGNSDKVEAASKPSYTGSTGTKPASTIGAARPSAAGTVLPRRFLNAQPRQDPAISREEEYRFIRADLVTVFVLAILMIITLVILTLVLGR